MIQMSLIITSKHFRVIFKLISYKFQSELSMAEMEARLKQELIIKESKVRVAAIIMTDIATVIAITALASPTWRLMVDEEDKIIT